MQVKLTSRHGTVKDDAQDHMRNKSERLVSTFERITQIEVTTDFEHDDVRIEILVDTEHRHDFVAHAEGAEVVAVFDAALHKMEQQIRRYKGKLQDHRRDVPMSGDVDAPTDAEDDEDSQGRP